MNLVPLLDHSGHVKAWADPVSSWIIDLVGTVFAFVFFNGIFTRHGIQIGWWMGDHIRNRYGLVVLSQPDAEIDGIKIPLPKGLPTPPKAHLPTSHPAMIRLLTPLSKKHQWADFSSLHHGFEQLRAYEKKARRLRPKSNVSDPTSSMLERIPIRWKHSLHG
ncbi:MAG: hypothetical protein P4L50_00890 [Anaerolineaceae bacterium]|nr:hypothetical protein [Anaerolineaceae bacterium]